MFFYNEDRISPQKKKTKECIMNFAHSLKAEFGSEKFLSCIRDGKVEIYYAIHLTEPKPHILLLFDQSLEKKTKCSFWEADLSDESMTQHVSNVSTLTSKLTFF
jgi:hypothetical protein